MIGSVVDAIESALNFEVSKKIICGNNEIIVMFINGTKAKIKQKIA